jgi:hypothetical protein
MSAPDSPSSKARPSLLSETAKSAADNDSRILANLEGRVAAQPNSTRRSKKHWIVATAAILGLGAFGAWQWQRTPGDDGASGARVATAASARNATPQAAAAPAASAAITVAATAASGADGQTLKTAASAPQPAIIVADTAADDRSASASVGTLASAAKVAPAAAVTAASTPDGERLSRALSEGTPASASASSSAAHAKSVVAAHQSTKATASRNVHEADKRHQGPRIASTHQRKDVKGGAKKADPDVDLLTALVARTKPYDANHGKTSGKTATPAAHKTQTATSGVPGLAERVADCSTRGVIEGQFCRWHVCADHWGKDPACPSSSFQSGSSN